MCQTSRICSRSYACIHGMQGADGVCECRVVVKDRRSEENVPLGVVRDRLLTGEEPKRREMSRGEGASVEAEPALKASSSHEGEAGVKERRNATGQSLAPRKSMYPVYILLLLRVSRYRQS